MKLKLLNLWVGDYYYDEVRTYDGFMLFHDDKNVIIYSELESRGFDQTEMLFNNGEIILGKVLSDLLEVGDYIFGYINQYFILGTFTKIFMYNGVMHIQIETLETIDGIIEDFEYTLNQLKRTYKLNKIIKI